MKLPKVKLPKVKLPKTSKISFPKLKKASDGDVVKKEKKSKPFVDDVKSIFRVYKGQMIWISILSGFLLFLLNILIGVSSYGNTLNEGLKDKLGMYFYIRDDVTNQDQIYKQVLNLKDKLQDEGLKVNFLTKEDAMNFMKKRLPELTGSLEKFGMENPLPATLYVTFSNKTQYNILQSVMLENKDIILNVQDLDQIENLEEQEERIVNVIKLSNFIQILSISLIVAIALVILFFTRYFLNTIFTAFWQDIEVKKLLGASKSQIIMPFLWTIFYSIIGGFLISLILTGVSLGIFDYYMSQLFGFTLTSHLFMNWGNILLLFLIEILIIGGLLMLLSYRYVSRLHKKVK